MTTLTRGSENYQQANTLNRWLARAYTINWEVVIYTIIFIAAVFTRFADLGTRVMSHDESLHTYYSWRLYEAGDFQHTPLMHGPLLFHVTALFYFLFGDNDFTARIYTALLGVLMVMFPLLFRRWLGRTGAILASIMILISPMLLYYNRYIREDTPSIFFTMVMVYCTFMYLDGPRHVRRKARWLYIFAAAMLLGMASKESGFIYIAIFGSFMTLYWIVRLYQHFRRRPSRSLFYAVSLAVCLSGVAALIMYAVLNISLGTHPTLEDRVEFLVQSFQGVPTTTGNPFEFSLFLSWTLLVVAAVIVVIVATALWAHRRGVIAIRLREVVVLSALTLVLLGGLIVFEELAQLPSRSEEILADPEADEIDTTAETNAPIIAFWVVCAGVVALLLYSWRAGWWRTLYRFPEFDILLIMGTLILPWLTPLVLSMTGADPTDYSWPGGIMRAVITLIPAFAVSITMGLIWNWKRWLIAAAIYHLLFVFFYTTMFTNPMGLATGMVGSLGYWLEQQGVKRGSQPQYYYQLIVMPIYEFLPMIGSFLAMLAGFTFFWRFRRRETALVSGIALPEEGNGQPEAKPKRDEVEAFEVLNDPGAAEAAREAEQRNARFSERWLSRMPFLLYVAYWAVFNFVAYTLAGEKMPWLATHITLPMIFLAAWYFGRVFDNTDWAVFRQRGWVYLLLLPLLFVAAFQAAAPFLTGQSPFAGLQQQQLAEFYQWLAVIAVVVVVGMIIAQVAARTGWKHVRHMIGVAAFAGLALLTFRAAWTAAFINYDRANEFLVYAHGAPGIKLMMEQIEDLSLRTTDGLNLRFAWGGNSWPVTWYFRDLKNATFFGGDPRPQTFSDVTAVYASADIQARVEPLLEDRFYRFEYIRMWWPMQDYFGLNAQRVGNALDFSPSNMQAGEIRRGMFDIWWNRDYTRYGQAVGQTFDLQTWPVSERMYFYVRKDIASQVWNLGVGEGTVLNPQPVEASLCTSNWQQLFAEQVYTGPDNVALNHPLDLEIGPDGRVYVAEEFASRITVFNPDGTFAETYSGMENPTGIAFNRPNGVAFDAEGNLWVADTWNYRLQNYMLDGTYLTGWGQIGQFGEAATTNPTDAFWGPRDVEIDANGNIYVADTGNRRIRVYAPSGELLRDIGGSGTALGQLREPSGIAISPDGRLFVADTWNRRVSVFALDGTPQYTFDVRGWYEDLGNRPYLELDAARNLLYVTDPDAGRVLVYDTQGNCVGSFGQPSDNVVDTSQFNIVGGITLDRDGNVYVSDAAAGRVLRFAPFVALPVGPQPITGVEAQTTPEVELEAMEEVTAEAELEVTPESTEAVG